MEFLKGWEFELFLMGFMFFGFLAGGFLNAVIDRLPLGLFEELKESKGVGKNERFFCFLLKLFCVASFLFCFFKFGLTLKGFAAMLFVSFAVCLAGIDLKYKLLPDILTLGLLWIGLLLNLKGVWSSLPNAVLGAALGYLMLWSLYWGFKFFTGKEGLGFGDFKLMAALGAWFGAFALPEILWISGVIGLIFGGVWHVRTRLVRAQEISAEFPFGPAIVFSGCVELFWGNFLS